MSKSLRQLARGKPCMCRIPAVCNWDIETTVLAHIRRGFYGRGIKPPDTCGVWACSACHDVLDGRVKSSYTESDLDSIALRALCQQLEWYDKHEILVAVVA
ncbi:MAG: nuclease domain-containing protein [Gammaproteobacteria bacterium]